MKKVYTATLFGHSAKMVEVETDISNGLPATIIVGLPDTMVQESKERVRSALRHTSFSYPATRVSINLAPSNLPKVGSHFDVSIALSILLSAALLDFDPAKKLFIGELSLGGQVRAGRGVLPMVLEAQRLGFTEAFVPSANASETALVSDIDIYPVTDLNQLLSHMNGENLLSAVQDKRFSVVHSRSRPVMVDFKDVVGQVQAKRALVVAAAGAHNVRMIGPPGSGKTMLAKAFEGILPSPIREEVLEVASIYSMIGQLKPALHHSRPFRDPHHTASRVALIGGGTQPRPGEVSLAHTGVLFLDELPEFPRSVLEVLRQPLEEGWVTIARASQTVRFPARFILVAAQNPCHCGNFGDPRLECTCHPAQVVRYNKKVSGPLLDRIDLHVNVPRMLYSEFGQAAKNLESSTDLRAAVVKARSIQHKRFGSHKTNSQMSPRDIDKYCTLTAESDRLLQQAADRYLFSGRSVHRILKLTRTIADLDSSSGIKEQHLAEALQYKVPL